MLIGALSAPARSGRRNSRELLGNTASAAAALREVDLRSRKRRGVGARRTLCGFLGRGLLNPHPNQAKKRDDSEKLQWLLRLEVEHDHRNLEPMRQTWIKLAIHEVPHSYESLVRLPPGQLGRVGTC